MSVGSKERLMWTGVMTKEVTWPKSSLFIAFIPHIPEWLTWIINICHNGSSS